MATDGRWQPERPWYGYRPPADVSIDTCPVCPYDVFNNGADDHVPVKMPDGRWTHARCAPDYPAVVARLEAADGADPWPWDDDHLGTATSMQAEYEEQQHRRYA